MNDFDNLTIIVSSCDKYYEAWELMFTLLKKHGGNLTDCRILLNTETKKYKFEGLNIDCTSNYFDGSGMPWGKRLKKTLELVNTDYVLFMMEDYFLQRDVDTFIINQCINWLDNNAKVGCFNLVPLYGCNAKSDKFKGFCEAKPGVEYRFNAQTAIWRRSVLYDSILNNESPWDWEVFGNLRNNVLFENTKIFMLDWNENQPFFTDLYIQKGGNKDKLITHNGIMKGKWDVDLVKPLCEANNIYINFDNLGVYEWPRFQKRRPKFIDFIAKETRPVREFLHLTKKETDEQKREREIYQEKYKKFVTIPIKEFKEINAK